MEAVRVWWYPAWTYAPVILTPPVFAHDDLVAEAQGVLEGATAEQVVRHSENADLLVIGHRGRGGFAGLLLGSMAHQGAAHARCPVVIVR